MIVRHPPADAEYHVDSSPGEQDEEGSDHRADRGTCSAEVCELILWTIGVRCAREGGDQPDGKGACTTRMIQVNARQSCGLLVFIDEVASFVRRSVGNASPRNGTKHG